MDMLVSEVGDPKQPRKRDFERESNTNKKFYQHMITGRLILYYHYYPINMREE